LLPPYIEKEIENTAQRGGKLTMKCHEKVAANNGLSVEEYRLKHYRFTGDAPLLLTDTEKERNEKYEKEKEKEKEKENEREEDKNKNKEKKEGNCEDYGKGNGEEKGESERELRPHNVFNDSRARATLG